MNENPIATRSKNRLANALGELLAEKRLESITITELCARAKLSRPAFYQNFSSICDVAARYLKTALDVEVANIGTARYTDANSYYEACDSIFASAKAHIDVLLNNGLVDIVLDKCTEAFLAIVHRPGYRFFFAASGMANALVREGDRLDHEELISVLECLIN